MRVLFIILFFCGITNCFPQDTIIQGKDTFIYINGKISEKIFKSSQNYIKIVYQYDEYGLLIRRKWYDVNGKLLSVCVDN